ncbi:MAG: hypothetical protein E7Z77_01915 [Methanobrevibacter sp.]|uniref:hypothetical protein n=1 Tax=Methanobrevibacter sp. TaxID=66852 RepID=UPI0025EB222D|nr:hypothetical protein [Methanobrevibacter sp.]MBE6508148.1 hypothetical protein [Methanobrevibacter sp.]
MSFKEKNNRLIIISFLIYIGIFVICLSLSAFYNTSRFLDFFPFVILFVFVEIRKEFESLSLEYRTSLPSFSYFRIVIFPILISFIVAEICLRILFNTDLSTIPMLWSIFTTNNTWIKYLAVTLITLVVWYVMGLSKKRRLK